MAYCIQTYPNGTSKLCRLDEPDCCEIKKHRELWETWYFWFGVGLIFLFVIISATSYLANSCKKKQQNLIRIRNWSHNTNSAPVISTISGPGGIIQPDIKHLNQAKGTVQNSSGTSTDAVEDFTSPLYPPYPAVEQVTIIRGSAPPEGFRQTNTYTEIVLPPGYVDTDNSKT